jgi:putative hydrolase of the HAD superfamily
MKEPFEDVRAVFFDVDDTLYDFETSMRHAFEHLHRVFQDVFSAHKVDDIERAYWAYYRGVEEDRKVALINSDPDLFRRTMWGGALASLGLDGSLHGLARSITDEMQRMRPQHWRMSMYPGAADLLSDLKPRLILGAITNGPSLVQRPKLEALRYRDYFPEERVFVSGEFGARKPDPSIFRAAARSAGVEPAECLMVGDAREFDMPAKAVGFRTILFTGPRPQPDVSKDEFPPDAVAANYGQVRRLILG